MKFLGCVFREIESYVNNASKQIENILPMSIHFSLPHSYNQSIQSDQSTLLKSSPHHLSQRQFRLILLGETK